MIELTDIEVRIARFLTGLATPEEALLLEDWIAQSADNRRYFEQCCLLLDHARITVTSEESKEAWEKVKEGFYGQKKRGGSMYRWTAGVAASLILLVVSIWLLHRGDTKETPVLANSAVYAAGTSSRKIELGSSVVVLNPGAQLTVADKGKMHLKGSAFFSVQHDSLHPVVIETGELFVKDIGTKFTISSSPGEAAVMVSVHEGEVSLYDNHGATANIYKGEQAVYVAATRKLEIVRRENTVPPAPRQEQKALSAPRSADSANGTVVFDCSGCATRGQLWFIYGDSKDTIKTNITLFRTWSPEIVRHIELMKPGEYKWLYNDALGINASGKLTVTGNTEQVVRFPEP